MRDPWQPGDLDRRSFLKGMAALSGAVLATGCAGASGTSAAAVAARTSVPGPDRMGIGLFTVRDLTPTDYEGTLAKLAEIGFKEVEPTGYGPYTPQQFRAMLDRVGLTAPSTHANLIPGPNLERQLERYQIIGHRFARSATSAPAQGQGGGGGAGAGGGGGQGGGAGQGAGGAGAGQGARPAGAAPAQPTQTVDTWKRTSEVYNQVGETAKRYGIKVLIHNHTAEFGPLQGSSLRPIDVLLAETDPDVVVFELDIGWSSVAGQDAVEMFRRNPGRFPLWHVKDVTGLSTMTPQQTMAERQRAARMAKVGEGEIDWKTIFANASLAGLQHYFLEIEGEAVANGSLEAARISYNNLRRIIS